LQRQGLIRSEWRPSESGRRRRYYRLERKGRAALERERRQWLAVHETLEKVWAK
jgi:DNA-binding PadR family transcriptional regulator